MTKSKRSVDLNAARAARAEATQEPVELLLGDDIIHLPPELDLDVIEPFGRVTQGDIGGLGDGMRALFAHAKKVDANGKELEALDYETIKARHGLSLDDVMALFNEVFPLYGMEAPPSPASPRS